MKHIRTRELLVNDGWFYMKEITRCVGISTGIVFSMSKPK